MSKKAITPEQLKATEKVYQMRIKMNDIQLCEVLDISKVTLYTRLKLSNWGKGELCLISGYQL